MLCGPYSNGCVVVRLGVMCESDGVVSVSFVGGSIASGAGFGSAAKASGEDGRSSEEGWADIVIVSGGFGNSSDIWFVV